MTQITADWIKNPRVQRLAQAFLSHGFEIYFVGGCVRNALMGAPVADLDLSTNARPEQMVELAKAAGFRPVPTGIDHGTITVVVEGEGFEITTYRKDVETDGRRAVVAFADTMEEDANRRDFTMNALYADAGGRVIDPLNGLPDLLDRRVRFIDDATARIREDYLRTLRFFRFYAWYSNEAEGPDQEALAAISANLGGLETLSRERVGAEMLKLLSATNPAPAVATMAQCGVLQALLPGTDARGLPILVHLEDGLQVDPIRRLAVLGGVDVARSLRLSRKEAKTLQALRDGMGSMTGAAELAYREGADLARDILLLRAAQMELPLPIGYEVDITKGAAAQFPITPADLMPAFSGPALGAELKRREALWIASDFTLTREELLT